MWFLVFGKKTSWCMLLAGCLISFLALGSALKQSLAQDKAHCSVWEPQLHEGYSRQLGIMKRMLYPGRSACVVLSCVVSVNNTDSAAFSREKDWYQLSEWMHTRYLMVSLPVMGFGFVSVQSAYVKNICV